MLRRATMVLLLAGCTDFTLVDPPSSEQTSLEIFLNQREDTVLTLGISGFFFAGTDGSGQVALLQDSTLTVDGDPATSRVLRGQALSYDWVGRFTDPGSVPESVHLRGPSLAGTSVAAPQFPLLLPRRRQPFRMDLVAGEDLLLVASNAPINATRVHAVFAMRVVRDGDGILTTQVETVLPDPLRIPWTWLAGSAAVGDSLDVSVSRFESYELDTTQYRTSVLLYCEFLWRVRITAAAAPAP